MLTNKERNFLRARGNELNPIVIIGKSGVTDTIIEQLDQALVARELVKCRVLPHTEFEASEIALKMARATQAEVVQVIGQNMLLYRKSAPGKPSKLNWPAEE